MASFEEARHQGYSAADMAADAAEQVNRLQQLGCGICRYRLGNYHVCAAVIEDKDNVFEHCPYKKEAE